MKAFTWVVDTYFNRIVSVFINPVLGINSGYEHYESLSINVFGIISTNFDKRRVLSLVECSNSFSFKMFGLM